VSTVNIFGDLAAKVNGQMFGGVPGSASRSTASTLWEILLLLTGL
jgi:hypothetical protein